MKFTGLLGSLLLGLLNGCAVDPTNLFVNHQNATPGLRPTAQGNKVSDVSTTDSQSRRYNLDVSALIDSADGGEFKQMRESVSISNKPTPLAVMREGRNGRWSESPLPGLENKPLYLNCRYEITDRSNPRSANVISRDIKFWFSQKPSLPSASVYPALQEIKLADVALSSCPSTWGDALETAIGPQVWGAIKTKGASSAASTGTAPANPNTENNKGKDFAGGPRSGKESLPPASAKTKYARPEIMDPIVQGRLNAVNEAEIWSKFFLVNVAASIGHFCPNTFSGKELNDMYQAANSVRVFDNSNATIMLQAITRYIDLAHATANPSGFDEHSKRENLEAAKMQLSREEEGAYDALVLLARYGCSGSEVSQFKKNAWAFIRGEGTQPLSMEYFFQSCNSNYNKSGSRLGMNYCGCIARNLIPAPMTRAERIGMNTDFPKFSKIVVRREDKYFDECR